MQYPTLNKVVAVRAVDWGHTAGQMDVRDNFKLYEGWIIGLLVQEDEDKLVLAHNWFEDAGDVRATTAIPKVTIQERHEWNLREEAASEPSPVSSSACGRSGSEGVWVEIPDPSDSASVTPSTG